MRIRRYLLQEVLQTFFAVILVVLLIAISNQVVRLLGKAAIGAIAPNVLFEVILLKIPELLAFLLPIALFLAILLCFSRFFADNEIPVMFACGASWTRLLSVSMSMGVLIMLLAGGLTCYWGPQLAQYSKRLLSTDGPMLLLQTAASGRFHSVHQDGLVFYVSDLNADRTELKHIFIADQAHDSILSADGGKIVTDPESGSTYLKLENGRRYQGTPGERDYSILRFEEYQRLIEGGNPAQIQLYHRTMPTYMLWEDLNPVNMAELQWRISVPLSALLLALLAVPLSQVAPRAGRFSRLFPAIIICILYFNLLTVSKRYIAAGTLSPILGLWWVHVLVLIGGLLFLAKTSGRAHQAFYALKKRGQHNG